MRALVVAFLIGVATAPSRAESVRVEGVVITEFGIYQTDDKKVVDDPNLAGNKRVVTSNVVRKAETTQIPGQLKTIFGVRYKIVGAPVGQPVELQFATKFPDPGLKDPSSGQAIRDNSFAQIRTIGDIHYRGYGFDNDWEIVPGKWTFQFSYEGRILAEQVFYVSKTEQSCSAPSDGTCK
jgi:hypothetical protein